MAPLQIFKTGRHTATNGKVIEFTESHLKASADAYKPELHEAPFVVGHPDMDAPAYGWAKSLASSNGVLFAEPHQVDAAFAEMVNAGRFNKISASFYEPDAPRNPVPGVYYVRHVGFLGAQPPSVRGLKSVSFAEDEKGVASFADWGNPSDARSVSFAAPPGYTIDPVRLELHDQALAYQQKHPGVTYDAAIAEVLRCGFADVGDTRGARSVSFAAPPGYTIDPVRLDLHDQALAYQQKHPGTTYDAAIAAVSH